MRLLILFDIDGTILYPGTLARELMNEVVTEFTGTSPDLKMEDVAGFTDPVIIREALKKVQYDGDAIQYEVQRLLDLYIERLKKRYPSYNKPQLYNDCVKLVDRCKGEGWPVGLLTGNLKRGAKIKLERFGIWDRFDFGVFGEDGREREDLVRMASGVARNALGEAYSSGEMIMVGDTPNDARVAYLNGLRSLIVARHPEWKSRILRENPTLLVDSFDDIETIIRWMKKQ